MLIKLKWRKGPKHPGFMNGIGAKRHTKDAIDAIRTIGNNANHQVQFVGRDEAKRSMQIVTYMLNTIYSLPAA